MPAGPPRAGPQRRPARPDAARAGTVRLIEAMTDVPAVIMGRRTKVLAWNRLGHALLGGHYDFTAPTGPPTGPTSPACCSSTVPQHCPGVTL
ncbi:hypothetical protein ABGB12_13925 [Actinocorallia sp. B10E7]